MTATAPLTTPKRKGVPAVAGHVERRVRRPAIRDFSEQELHAELARRRALREDKTPKRWCDECEHFKPSDDPKLTKNPCSKSHAMHFIMPESPGDYEWGFYRRQCADWTPNVRAKAAAAGGRALSE